MADNADIHIDQDNDLNGALPAGQDTTPAAKSPGELRAKRPKEDLVPVISEESADALDALLAASTDNETDEKTDNKTDDGTDKKAGEKADAAGGDAPAGDGKPDKDDGAPAGGKPDGAGDAGAAGADNSGAGDKPADSGGGKKDALDAVELPPYTKPKAAESFARVKEIARQQIRERDEKLAKLEADLAESRRAAEEAAKNAVPPEQVKELEDLRNWRKTLDVDGDPRWKTEFDDKVSANVESVYRKLADAGMDKTLIDEIKKLGGPAVVDWEPILPKLPLAARRFIEAKLVENESLNDRKREELAAARKNAIEFVKGQSATERKAVESLVGKMPWFKPLDIPASATPEKKAQLEAQNRFAKEQLARLDSFLNDRSPAARAELVAGTLLAYHYKLMADGLSANVAQEKTAHEAALKKVQDELASATKELERIKKASGAGRQVSSAPERKSMLVSDTLLKSGSQALDDLRNAAERD